MRMSSVSISRASSCMIFIVFKKNEEKVWKSQLQILSACKKINCYT